MKRAIVTLAFLSGALTACGGRGAPSATATFSPEQRTQIVQTLREAMKRDPTILRDAILVLQADNARLEAQAQHDAVANHENMLFAPGDPSIGDPHATLTMVEFFDPRCPYCRQMAPQLSAFVAKNPDVRLVYKDLPILGPASEFGSHALLAAQRQGKYEALREALMSAPSTDFTEGSIREAAQRLGIDWPKMAGDMHDPAIDRTLAANKELAAALGIEGTPTVVVGDKIVEGADLPTIAAAVANARHDRSRDRSKPLALSRAPH